MAENLNRSSVQQQLRDRHKKLTSEGLRDIKFWYVGGTSDASSVDELCEEANAVLDVYDRKEFVDISHKLK